MALIKCPKCQKDVSSMISRCPFCNTDLTQVDPPVIREDSYYDSNSDSDFSGFSIPEENELSDNPPIRSRQTANDEADQKPVSCSRKRRKSPPPAGRRLLGYRSRNPFNMFMSVFYHMAACVGILYAFSISPRYLESGGLLFPLCRVILAAIMLFLPVVLLSDTKLRKKVPFFRSRKAAAVITGFAIVYIPLAVLFSISCYFCLQLPG